MQQIINKICERALSELKGVSDSKSLDELRVRILGKKGELTGILRSMGQVSAELRPKIGQWVNEARETIENALAEAQKQIARRELEQRLESEKLDVTLPVQDRSEGSLHPMSLVLETLLDIFTGMGFEAVEGPEVEYDHFNFELMNIPKNHPARDAQDTFYVDDNIVLRTHTGRVWYECDIDYDIDNDRGRRNGKRIVFSNDGLIYYTEDHYNTFELLYEGWYFEDAFYYPPEAA